MKALLTFVGMIIIFSQSAFGQILERESKMSLGVQTSNEVVLNDISPKDALKLWKEYFKEYGKIKRNKKADEYYSTGVRINRIYNVSNIDVYVRFEEKGSNSIMLLWVDLGMAFVNSKDYPMENRGVLDLIDKFRISTKKYVIQEEADIEETALNKMKKDLIRLEKNNVKLHDAIIKYEEKIVLAKDDIITNVANQDEKRIEIDRQLDLLKEIQIRLESIK